MDAEILGYALNILSVANIGAMLVGVSVGLVIGAIPGLSPPMAIALLIPVSFQMPPDTAIFLLVSCYAAGIYGGHQLMSEQGSIGPITGLAILLPFLVILAYKWRENESPLGEKILVVAVEGFESIISYVSNTLSFLRVAAFSLNHVALAIAVFTLADMLGETGHWITVVLGNIFIIVVEGFIVTIQVLRLEYYEGFSRFFRGDGRSFKPLGYRAS